MTRSDPTATEFPRAADPPAAGGAAASADRMLLQTAPIPAAHPPLDGADAPDAEATPEIDPDTDALFEQAVQDHGRRLLAIARSIVGYRASPEDVVQQAVMNLFKHRHRYDWHKPGGLLKRAVVNEALRLLRPPRMSEVSDDAPSPRSDEDPAEVAEENETVRRVRAAIDQLPEHFRGALVLCEYERMSYADIAETLGASVPQVKTWIFRARRKMADLLSDYMEGRE